MNLEEHLKRQIAFSRATFGPGARTAGVIDHIRKELVEVEKAETDWERINEWVDVVILALDGLTRAIKNKGNPGERTTSFTAMVAVDNILAKQNQNELRDWPDWRTSNPEKAIEHVKPVAKND